jgi:hypothetical protein
MSDSKEYYAKIHAENPRVDIDALIRERDAAREQVARLREALEPFATFPKTPWRNLDDNTILEVSRFNVEAWRREARGGLRVHHFRRAREALAQIDAALSQGDQPHD